MGLWALSQAVDDPYRRGQIALLATLLAAVAIAPSLAGADIHLDRTAAIAWPPRRAVHLVIAGAIAVALLAATALAGDPMSGTARIARDTTGLTGLVGLGAAVLGAGRAPAFPLLWTTFVIGLGPPDTPQYQVMLTWMIQPTDATPATVAALILGAAGTFAYASLGPRR